MWPERRLFPFQPHLPKLLPSQIATDVVSFSKPVPVVLWRSEEFLGGQKMRRKWFPAV